MPRIVTLTLNPAVDKSCAVQQVVAERKLRCGTPEWHPGGGGINVARVLAELGGDATAIWTCGGALGELLRSLLEKEGVEQHPIPVARMTRENLTVYEEASGQQFRFGMAGAELSAQEVQQCLAQLKSIQPAPDFVVLSGSLPHGVEEDLYARIAAALVPACKVVVDTSGTALRRALETPVFLIKPNLHELEQLARRSIDDEAGIREAAQALIREEKAHLVVVSLGSGGAMLCSTNEVHHVRAPTVRVRSKVGAGDSMVAGMVFALSRGRSHLEAVRMGVAAGTAAVMTEGTELCRKSDTERIFKTMAESSEEMAK